MEMPSTKTKIYRPSKFSVGYSKAADNARHIVKLGFPSCRWLAGKTWTELGAFTRHTNGFKPHTQRDGMKQLLKEVNLAVEELSNDLVSGFKILEVGWSPSHSWTLVFDPRGFYLRLSRNFLENVVLKHHLSISGSGELEGKWTYVWKDGRFAGLAPESCLADVVDDKMLEKQSQALRSFKLGDLVSGRVYDLASKTGDKSQTQRVVYIGELELPSLPALKRFFQQDGRRIPQLHSGWRSHVHAFTDEDLSRLGFLPWNSPRYHELAEDMLKPWKLTPVFLLLEDHVSGTFRDDVFFCDDLAGVPPEELEHSIAICLTNATDHNCLLAGKDIMKRLVNESSDQALKVITDSVTYARRTGGWKRKIASCSSCDLDYTSPSEFKTMKLEMLKLGVEKYVSMLKAMVQQKLELAPPRCPDNIEAWIAKVDKWSSAVDNGGPGNALPHSYCVW